MDLGVSVFEAFQGGLISGVYEIGKCQRGTVIGSQFVSTGDLDVLVDDGDYSDINNAPNAAETNCDMLMYCKPGQLPTRKPRVLAASYMVHDKTTDEYFAITRANLGRNQHNGRLEHVELELTQTEVVA